MIMVTLLMICVVVKGSNMFKITPFWKYFLTAPTTMMMFLCIYLLLIAEHFNLTDLSHTVFFMMWVNIFTYVWWIHITTKGYKPLITKLLP